MYPIDLSGHNALVTGVANKWSIAWAIARALHEAGARLVLPWLSEREQRSIEKLVTGEGWSDVVVPPDPCNVAEDRDLDRLFGFVEGSVGTLSSFTHSIAFAPGEALQGSYADTSRDAFRIALDISAYSLVAMTRRASAVMPDGGSIISITFMASEKVFPSYNVMGTAKAALEHATRQLAAELGPSGVRVNAISAGPINTTSARGVKGFGDFKDVYRTRAPLRREVTQEEVGRVALFLLSDLSSGVTGEIVHVDGGYNILGM